MIHMETASPEQIKEINEYGKEIIELLKLETSPVAVALLPKGAEVPGNIHKIDQAMRHCQIVDRVRKTREEFYAALESASFMPDVVVIICSPKQIMLLTQAILYNEGGRVEAEFAGKQSLCSDAVAQPYLTGKMGITVGCSGSRTYTGIQESELTVGIPAKLLKDLVEGLRAIVGKAA